MMRKRDDMQDLDEVARRVAVLGGQVCLDPYHRERLRRELLRRHVTLRSDWSAGAARVRRPWRAGLKPLSMAAPPVLAALLVLVAVLGGLQVTGHDGTRQAEAARLPQALAQTMPTVTSWQVSVHRERGSTASWYLCPGPHGQRLYLRGDHLYLYSGGTWYLLSTGPSNAPCSPDLVWAFALLPQRLAQGHAQFLPASALDGRPADEIRYVLSGAGASRVQATAWVDRQSGLLLRLERVTVRNGQIVERESADYRYDYQRRR